MKHENMETGSGTAFPRLYFQDCISGTAVLRSRESGLHFTGLHFKYHGSRIAFLQLLKLD